MEIYETAELLLETAKKIADVLEKHEIQMAELQKKVEEMNCVMTGLELQADEREGLDKRISALEDDFDSISEMADEIDQLKKLDKLLKDHYCSF